MGLPTVDPFRQGAGAAGGRAGMRLDGRGRRPSRWPRAFTISRGSRTEARVLTVTVGGGRRARARRMRALCPLRRDAGERRGADRGPAGAASTARRCSGCCRPGAARNAVDCALWDLEAKRSGRRVWQLAGLAGAGAGDHRLHAVARHARGDAGGGGAARAPAAPEDQARRRGRHGAARGGAGGRAAGADHRRRQRGLDARRPTPRWRRRCCALGVELVEQPLPAGADEALAEMARPLPVCADESCHDRGEPRRRWPASTTWSTSSSTRPAG